MTRLLAIDTATEACSAALWLDGQLLPRFEHAGRTHTQKLAPMVQGLLDEAGICYAQLDGLVCGIGPGSFAGVRIAVSFVKGLALALDRPVYGVSTLAMLAQAACERGAEQVLAAIDARMGEVYFGAYRRNAEGLAQSLGQDIVCAPQAVPPAGKGSWSAAGTGWSACEAELRAATGAALASVDGAALPAAAEALRLSLPAYRAGGFFGSDRLLPAYLRDKVALTLEEQAQLRKENREIRAEFAPVRAGPPRRQAVNPARPGREQR